jgi:hypothetical protein
LDFINSGKIIQNVDTINAVNGIISPRPTVKNIMDKIKIYNAAHPILNGVNIEPLFHSVLLPEVIFSLNNREML